MTEEENKSNNSNAGDSTYDKAKEYWGNQDATFSGMLGG